MHIEQKKHVFAFIKLLNPAASKGERSCRRPPPILFFYILTGSAKAGRIARLRSQQDKKRTKIRIEKRGRGPLLYCGH